MMDDWRFDVGSLGHPISRINRGEGTSWHELGVMG